MADTVKFTEEELVEIKELQTRFTQCTYNAGRAYLERQQLEAKELAVKQMYGEVKQAEFNLIQKLNEKYGAGSINLETGEFTPLPDEETEE
jgi:hypothetical protein